jgi:hypothetical protein
LPAGCSYSEFPVLFGSTRRQARNTGASEMTAFPELENEGVIGRASYEQRVALWKN